MPTALPLPLLEPPRVLQVIPCDPFDLVLGELRALFADALGGLLNLLLFSDGTLTSKKDLCAHNDCDPPKRAAVKAWKPSSHNGIFLIVKDFRSAPKVCK
jgi:hypothetical protein